MRPSSECFYVGGRSIGAGTTQETECGELFVTRIFIIYSICLLYTSDAADDLTRVDLGGRLGLGLGEALARPVRDDRGGLGALGGGARLDPGVTIQH